MKKIISLSVMTMLVCGCASTPTAPIMPKFQTEKGKACARECQTTYAQCTKSCGVMISGGGAWPKQGEGCFNNCNQVLAECYTTCE